MSPRKALRFRPRKNINNFPNKLNWTKLTAGERRGDTDGRCERLSIPPTLPKNTTEGKGDYLSLLGSIRIMQTSEKTLCKVSVSPHRLGTIPYEVSTARVSRASASIAEGGRGRVLLRRLRAGHAHLVLGQRRRVLSLRAARPVLPRPLQCS